MIFFPLPTWRHAVLAMSMVAFAAPAVATPLSFETALQLAEHTAPSLSAEDAQLEAARQAAIPAGELPDPKLVLGIDNLPITGPDRFNLTRDFMTMRRIGVMQEVPNSDKRQARVDVAQSTIDRVVAERRIERLKVRRETALAWIARYTVERKLALFDALYRENRLLTEAVRTRNAAGRGLVMDSILPRQEAAALTDRHDQLERERSDAEASLKRWIGPAGSEPLVGEAPTWPVSAETLAHHLHYHPELAVYDSMTNQAEAEVREAESTKNPDWAVELAYQQRGPDFSNMASIQFTFDLPVFAARRQDPQIAAKRAELVRIDAERETTLREHAQMLATDLAAYQQLDRAVQRQHDSLMPLAQEKVELALAAYRGSQTDLATVIAARSESIDARLKAIDLEGQRALVAARLHYAYGENK
ncbi:TolC family protein [Sulfuriferula sp.]|uniref:TolC family protein n=1 Tax=Sulfuriferula sp. TaxID=2025307 RepID=UPI002730075B|nr:TolC family protein [Sulfuriferula sp.]MDP2026511.1 TolC family protein [Sulfuriferula sp.]